MNISTPSAPAMSSRKRRRTGDSPTQALHEAPHEALHEGLHKALRTALRTTVLRTTALLRRLYIPYITLGSSEFMARARTPESEPVWPKITISELK